MKVSPVSTTCFNSKFVHTVLNLTQNYGVDYVVLSKNVPNCLPHLLADDANIVITENADTSSLSGVKFKKKFSLRILTLLFLFYFILVSGASNRFSLISAQFENILIANEYYVADIHSFIESKILDFIKPTSFIVFPYSEVKSAFR